MTACWVHGCTAPATRTVQIQASSWRVPESRRVCIAHAESVTQEPPMSKTQPTQAERVLEDVRAHPWTSVGDVVRRTRDAKAAARLVEAVQAGPFATAEEVAAEVAHRTRVATPTVLATANASLREIGGGIAKRRVGCTVALGSGSAFFTLSDEAARLLAPLLFQGVTVALLAPALSKPTPVVPEFPSAPTPDDDADLFAF